MTNISDARTAGNTPPRLFYRFADLKALGLVNNYTTLMRWVAKGDFPRGRMLGPNTRVWTIEEIDTWLDSRPAGNGGA